MCEEYRFSTGRLPLYGVPQNGQRGELLLSKTYHFCSQLVLVQGCNRSTVLTRANSHSSAIGR